MPTSTEVKRIVIHGYTPFAVCIMGYVLITGILDLISDNFASPALVGVFPGWQLKAYAAGLVISSATVLLGVLDQLRNPNAPLDGLAWEMRGHRVFVLVAGILTVAAFTHPLAFHPGGISNVASFEHSFIGALGPLSYACASAWRSFYCLAMLREAHRVGRIAAKQAEEDGQ